MPDVWQVLGSSIKMPGGRCSVSSATVPGVACDECSGSSVTMPGSV